MNNEIIKSQGSEVTEQYVSREMDMDLQEELAGLNITFDKIKVPSGGGLAFEVPGDNPDEPDLQKEFKAVILYQHPVLSYYKEKYNGGAEAPDCSSMDGVVGVDKNTGECKNCADCPFNKFDSADNGGKACKTKRRLFLLRENEMFPTILIVPTGSLIDFSNYIRSLIKKGRKSNRVVTKFSLKKDKNKNDIVFSKVVLSFDRDLTQNEINNVAGMAEKVKAMAMNIREVDVNDKDE